MGLSLGDEFGRMTITPATAVGLVGTIDTLVPGADADLSLLRLAGGEWRFEDSHGQVEYGGTRLEPVSSEPFARVP